MKTYGISINLLTALLFCLLTATAVAAQDPAQAPDLMKYDLGQKMTLEGVIVERSGDQFVVRDHSNRETRVKIGAATRIKEKKRNFLRSGAGFSDDDLIPGLNVVVKGVGDVEGDLIGTEILFTQDDLKVAQTIWSRVDPVEGRLTDAEQEIAENRDEIRSNKSDTDGRLEELDAAFQLSREEAREAREAAGQAQDTADEALEGVARTDERITALDDYNEVDTLIVLFELNSSELTAGARRQLDEFAAVAKGKKAFLFEVTGYASADGNADYNRILSEQRADQVVKYLVDEHRIPLRRILQAYGHGENLPASDNRTFEGRQQNRRVQVRFLISKAMAETGQQ